MAHAHHWPQTAAVLDIGGDTGALLVNAPAALAGAEIQLYDLDGRVLMHTEVHARRVDGRVVHAGLFPAVPEGTYRVDAGDPAPVHVRVTGGAVATVGGAAHVPMEHIHPR